MSTAEETEGSFSGKESGHDSFEREILRNSRRYTAVFHRIYFKYDREFDSDEPGGEILTDLESFAQDEEKNFGEKQLSCLLPGPLLTSDSEEDEELTALLRQRVVKVKKEICWDKEEEQLREKKSHLKKATRADYFSSDSESETSDGKERSRHPVRRRRRRWRKGGGRSVTPGDVSETLYETEYPSEYDPSQVQSEPEDAGCSTPPPRLELPREAYSTPRAPQRYPCLKSERFTNKAITKLGKRLSVPIAKQGKMLPGELDRKLPVPIAELVVPKILTDLESFAQDEEKNVGEKQLSCLLPGPLLMSDSEEDEELTALLRQRVVKVKKIWEEEQLREKKSHLKKATRAGYFSSDSESETSDGKERSRHPVRRRRWRWRKSGGRSVTLGDVSETLYETEYPSEYDRAQVQSEPEDAGWSTPPPRLELPREAYSTPCAPQRRPCLKSERFANKAITKLGKRLSVPIAKQGKILPGELDRKLPVPIAEPVVPIENRDDPNDDEESNGESDGFVSGYDSASDYLSGPGECVPRHNPNSDSENLQYVGSPNFSLVNSGQRSPELLSPLSPLSPSQFDENFPVISTEKQPQVVGEEREGNFHDYSHHKPCDSTNYTYPEPPTGERSHDMSGDPHMTSPTFFTNTYTNVTYITYCTGGTDCLSCPTCRSQYYSGHRSSGHHPPQCHYCHTAPTSHPHLLQSTAVPCSYCLSPSFCPHANPETVQELVNPETVQKPETVQELVDPETVQKLVNPETVQKPETVQELVDPETVQKLVNPETVQKLVDPETVQKLVNPEKPVNPESIDTLVNPETVHKPVNPDYNCATLVTKKRKLDCELPDPLPDGTAEPLLKKQCH